MEKTELVTMSPLVLAYLGDTVYETYIREIGRASCRERV